jgi:branched-chain amino acid transport system permease protein
LTLLIVVVFLLAVVPAWLGLYSGYIEFLLTVIGINVILTVSLNLINGYMGEFSVGHAAFMGVGAYTASLLTVWLFGENSVLGILNLPASLSLALFPVALVAGGIAAALFSLLVAVPSFRTRGDYLAIISLAVNFIFKSLVENMDAIGGPRGFMGMGGVLRVMGSVADAPWLLIWTFVAVVLTILIIRNFVTSTVGKSVVAIRDDEIAAEVMTVNTRRLKMAAFMLGCGLAGVAGGLHAHLLGFINPSSYFLLQSTLILVMVYLGGIGSISGSIISAVGFTLLLELLRPLDLFRWVLTPLLLIVLMLFRPNGIMGDRELPDVFPRLRQYFASAEEVIIRAPSTD